MNNEQHNRDAVAGQFYAALLADEGFRRGLDERTSRRASDALIDRLVTDPAFVKYLHEGVAAIKRATDAETSEAKAKAVEAIARLEAMVAAGAGKARASRSHDVDALNIELLQKWSQQRQPVHVHIEVFDPPTGTYRLLPFQLHLEPVVQEERVIRFSGCGQYAGWQLSVPLPDVAWAYFGPKGINGEPLWVVRFHGTIVEHPTPHFVAFA